MKSAANIMTGNEGGSGGNLRSAIQIKMRGPGFAERSAKVMSKYSYTMPKK